MANDKSAIKRHRQSEDRRMRNRMVESRVKTIRKKFLEAVSNKDKTAATTEFNLAIKLIDAAASKGIFKRNTADRKKSRLHKLYNSLSAS